MCVSIHPDKYGHFPQHAPLAPPLSPHSGAQVSGPISPNSAITWKHEVPIDYLWSTRYISSHKYTLNHSGCILYFMGYPPCDPILAVTSLSQPQPKVGCQYVPAARARVAAPAIVRLSPVPHPFQIPVELLEICRSLAKIRLLPMS